ncbi:Ger(x)C family spore germination protein [Paenibacillus sp. NPDC056579]|uniref:Ger(x)C family spore germination protein n=1 Tax=Paenibacillus sp. NPDC056579 TaxID=3345871 RepID=UPI0036BC3166
MIRRVAVCLLTMVLLTGCWNRRELNDLAIVVGMGIDKIGDRYEVTIQVVMPAEVAPLKGGTSGRAPVTIYHATGDTVFEAIRRMTTMTPRKAYFAHVRMFLIGEEAAKAGVSNLLDFISRDHELRTDFYFAVAKGALAKDLLSIYTMLEKIPANKMFNSIEVSQKTWAPSVSVTLDELIRDLVSNGKNPVLTGIEIVGNKEEGKLKSNVERIDLPTKVQYTGLAVFKKDKLVGWLDEYESKGYSDITDKLQSTVIEVACPQGGKLGVEIIRSKTTMNPEVKDGKPAMRLKTRSEANISDVECKIDVTKSGTIDELEKRIEEKVKMNSRLSIKKAQKLNSDIFGFGSSFHLNYPSYWDKIEQNWDRYFQHLPVHLEVEITIKRLGTIGEPLQNKIKE